MPFRSVEMLLYVYKVGITWQNTDTKQTLTYGFITMVTITTEQQTDKQTWDEHTVAYSNPN